VEVEERQIWGLPAEYRRLLKAGGLSVNINTSFVERINLCWLLGSSARIW